MTGYMSDKVKHRLRTVNENIKKQREEVGRLKDMLEAVLGYSKVN